MTMDKSSGALSNSPLRVLLWKEWREGRPIHFGLLALLLGTAVVYLLASRRIHWQETPAFVCVVAAAWGLVLGARAFASEGERGTDGFLLGLPAERRRVWLAKVLVVFAVPVCLGTSLVVVLAWLGYFRRVPTFSLGYFPPAMHLTLDLVEQHAVNYAAGCQETVAGCAATFAAAAAVTSVAVFVSVVIPKTITALLASCAASWMLVMVAAMVHFRAKRWIWAAAGNDYSSGFMFYLLLGAAAIALLTAAAFLWGSYRIFRRQRPSR